MFFLHVRQVYNIVEKQLFGPFWGDARNAFIGAVNDYFFQFPDFGFNVNAAVRVHKNVLVINLVGQFLSAPLSHGGRLPAKVDGIFHRSGIGGKSIRQEFGKNFFLLVQTNPSHHFRTTLLSLIIFYFFST